MGFVEVNELRKQYGRLTAADGVSFEIKEGEVFSLQDPLSRLFDVCLTVRLPYARG